MACNVRSKSLKYSERGTPRIEDRARRQPQWHVPSDYRAGRGPLPRLPLRDTPDITITIGEVCRLPAPHRKTRLSADLKELVGSGSIVVECRPRVGYGKIRGGGNPWSAATASSAAEPGPVDQLRVAPIVGQRPQHESHFRPVPVDDPADRPAIGLALDPGLPDPDHLRRMDRTPVPCVKPGRRLEAEPVTADMDQALVGGDPAGLGRRGCLSPAR